MKGKELLKAYPVAAKVITAWLLKELIASCDKPEIPGDFKDFVIQTGLSEERVADIIDDSPRMLFDVFDAHRIFVETTINTLGFNTKVHRGDGISLGDGYSDTRKIADTYGIQVAFGAFNDELIDSVKDLNSDELSDLEEKENL